MLLSASCGLIQCTTALYSSYGMVLASSMGATEELVQELGVLVKGNGTLAFSNPSFLITGLMNELFASRP